MFAASRIERVIGRTRILNDSIIGRNGIRNEGVPIGNIKARLEYGLFIYEEIIRENHNGKDKVKVIAKCLVVLNT